MHATQSCEKQRPGKFEGSSQLTNTEHFVHEEKAIQCANILSEDD